jgi:hypothetical protein
LGRESRVASMPTGGAPGRESRESPAAGGAPGLPGDFFTSMMRIGVSAVLLPGGLETGPGARAAIGGWELTCGGRGGSTTL